MATTRLAFSSPPPSLSRNRPITSFSFASTSIAFPYPTNFSSSISVSHSLDSSSIHLKTRVLTASAVAEEEPISAAATTDAEAEAEEKSGDDDSSSPGESKVQMRPCELYVCNLPRSCESSELLEMFKAYGNVQSAEISKNPETGVSRGCGYVTMSSFDEAKAAVSALDASDFNGREMRVRFSVDMNFKTLVPKRNMIFESPHKIYVGNLAWTVKPEQLREFFGQFGTVVSAKVLYDRKGGKNRVFGFVSFSSAEELTAAMSLDGKDFLGRNLLVRKALRSTEP